MKRVCVLLLLGMVALASGQQPEITDFTLGELTWTNPLGTVYYTLEWTWNLEYNWGRSPSDQTATNGVNREAMPDLGGLYNVAAALGDEAHGVFFRVLTDSEPIGPWTATNWVRVMNASTSVLEGLIFGIERDGQLLDSEDVGDLPPGSNTAYRAFSMAWPAPLQGSLDPSGYYLGYVQDESAREIHTGMFMPLGPLRMEVSITVSNDSFTVGAEWLPRSRTFPYDPPTLDTTKGRRSR